MNAVNNNDGQRFARIFNVRLIVKLRRLGCYHGGVVALGLSLLLVHGTNASGQANSREEELEAVRRQIVTLQEDLVAVRSRQSGLEGELAATELEIRLQEDRLDEARLARAIAVDRLSVSEAKVNSLLASLNRARRELQQGLINLYRLGRQGYGRLLLSVQDGGNLLPGIRLLRYMSLRDASSLSRYLEAQSALEVERAQFQTEKQKLEGWIGQEQQRQNDLVGFRGRQRALLARVERQREELASRQAELRDRERKLANFLDLLYGSTGVALGGTAIQEFRGILDWPAEGEVVAGFGPRLDPLYQTQVPHNGLDIQAAGALAEVVYPGTVVFAAPFEGYGQTVVVNHPGRVFTLYAGLASLEVAAGDVLSLGQVLGSVADDLYFEIRVENQPQDPRRWLR